jgi:6-pyruvoyl-tetrahydropterin synthase
MNIYIYTHTHTHTHTHDYQYKIYKNKNKNPLYIYTYPTSSNICRSIFSQIKRILDQYLTARLRETWLEW